jgi:hypothetical protein
MEGANNTATIDDARARTAGVERDLQVVSAELGLTHGALQRHLPHQPQDADVTWAIDQTAVLERKVQQAAQELEEVTELLDQAREEIARH